MISTIKSPPLLHDVVILVFSTQNKGWWSCNKKKEHVKIRRIRYNSRPDGPDMTMFARKSTNKRPQEGPCGPLVALFRHIFLHRWASYLFSTHYFTLLFFHLVVIFLFLSFFIFFVFFFSDLISSFFSFGCFYLFYFSFFLSYVFFFFDIFLPTAYLIRFFFFFFFLLPGPYLEISCWPLFWQSMS